MAGLPSVDDVLGAPPEPEGRPLTSREALSQLPMAEPDELGHPRSPAPAFAGPGLPTIDQLLGAASTPQEQFHPQTVPTGLHWDQYVQQAPMGRVLDAFGQGAAEGWGTGNLGMSPETEEALKKAGILPDVQKGQGGFVRGFNEAILRPLAAGVEGVVRGGSALVRGGLAAMSQVGRELPEGPHGLEPSAPGGVGGYLREAAASLLNPQQAAQAATQYAERALAGAPSGIFVPHVPSLPEARTLNVIGSSEGAYFGTEQPRPIPESVTRDTVRDLQEHAANQNLPGTVPATTEPGAYTPGGAPTGGGIEPYAPTQAPPRDVHEAARQANPTVFGEYDTLTTQRDQVRAQLADAQTSLRQQAEAQAPHAEEIADLQRRLEDTTPRLAKKYQERLAALIPDRDKFLADEFTMRALTRDTPEMEAMRAHLQQLDYRMRDLAPDVSAAYREARTQFPEEAPRKVQPVQPVSGAAGPPVAGVLPDVPRSADAGAEPPAAPQPANLGTQSRLPLAGERAPAEGTVRGVPGPTDGNAPPGLRPADRGDVGVSGASPAHPPGIEARPTEPADAAAGRERPAPVADIAADAARKLVAAGRPQEEANAAAAIVAAHYEARAARFGGAKGTAAELYTEEAPEVRRGGGPVPERAVAGREFEQRDEGAPVPLYSGVSRAVEGLKQARGSGDQMLAMLTKVPGVKPEEIRWLGLDEWLRGQKSVTREQIQEYVRANALDVRETTRGGQTRAVHEVDRDIDATHAELLRREPGTDQMSAHSWQDAWDKHPDLAERNAALFNERATASGGGEGTKFGSYTLPGGENYREMLITLPPKVADIPRPTPVSDLPAGYSTSFDRTAPTGQRWAVIPPDQVHGRPFAGAHDSEAAAVRVAVMKINADAVARWQGDVHRAETQGGYRSSHWDEPNVLAHIRFNERTAPDGKRVLMVEEVQSDWHQQGRKQGYRTPYRADELHQDAGETGRAPDSDTHWYVRSSDNVFRIAKSSHPTLEGAIDYIVREKQQGGGSIPDAPFKTTWPALTMKRVIKWAVDNGFDRVAWAPGEVQAARYDLSKQIRQLHYDKIASGEYLLAPVAHDGREIPVNAGLPIPEAKLADYVGKDIADKIIKGEGEGLAGGLKTLSGLDLKVGGEGMKGFYDRMLPNEVQKIVGKFGTRVEQSNLQLGLAEGSGARDAVWHRAMSDRLLEAARLAETEGANQGIIRSLSHAGERMDDPAVDSYALLHGLGDQPRAFLDRAGGIVDSTPRSQSVHSFEVTPQLKEAVEQQGLSLFQGARGRIRLGLDDGRSVITLMQSANASTFLHETGHAWLEELLADARDTRAPGDLVTDAQTVRDWLGAAAGEEITTRQHEKFARGFERYVMEGVAPSRALDRVFSQFRDWLTTIYRTVQRLRAPITDDIRDVFDRLLAKEPEPATLAAERPEPVREEPPQPTSRVTPYDRMPKEPERLTSFLRRLGGISDEGGDVRSILGGARFRPGLISHTGLSMDEAALRAWQAGYFPDMAERPTINDLRNALEDDLRDTPRYAHEDEGAVAAYHEAANRNAEIDRLATEHGIETVGKTREQFYDEVAAKLTEQQATSEIARLNERHEAVFDDFTTESKDVVESHGERWDADEFYGTRGPRSLEDLEDAYRSENAARPAGQGAARDEQPGPAGGPAPDGEGGAGHGGGVAGAAGRDGETERPATRRTAPTGRSDQPAGPNEPFGRAEPAAIDKAGNIRLDNLNQPADIEQVIRDFADTNGDFITARRGVVSDAEVLSFAEAMGTDARELNLQRLRQMSVDDGVPLGARILAGRQMLIQSATTVRDAMYGAAAGDEAAIMAYAQAKARHLMIQETLAGITAEMGRGLRAFQNLENYAEAQALGDFLKQATGRTLFQMQEEAKLGSQLETPAQVSKYMADLGKTPWQRTRAGIISYFVNNLISGPITHAAYSIGNTTFALWKAVPETLTQATVGAVREAVTGEAIDRVRFGEAGAQLYAMVRGLRDGAVPAWKAVQTGVFVPLGESQRALDIAGFNVRPQSIPGPVGRVLETPGRVVTGIHTLFYTMGYEQEIARLAYREGSQQGLDGNAFSEAVARFTQNPPAAAMEAAHDEAMGMVLMQRPQFGGARYHLAQIVNNSLPAKIVMPFMQIGMNILKQGLVERTPLAVLSADARAELSGARGPAARDLRIGKIATGSMLATATVGLAIEGLITGGGPVDPNKRRVMEESGWKAYSLKVGDTYVPFRKYLGPLGPLVAAAADIHEIAHTLDNEGLTKAAAAAAFGFAEVVADETWMAGLSNFVDAARHWDTKGEQYFRGLATSFLPFSSLLNQTSKLVDPYQRQARTILDAARAKIPFLSQGLEPQISLWGEPIPAHMMISPSTVKNDPVDQKLIDLDMGVTRPERKIRGVELTDPQYTDYATKAGRMAKMRLDALIGTPGFSALAPELQTKAIKETIEHSREAVRTMIMMKSMGSENDIVRKAMDNKRAAFGLH